MLSNSSGAKRVKLQNVSGQLASPMYKKQLQPEIKTNNFMALDSCGSNSSSLRRRKRGLSAVSLRCRPQHELLERYEEEKEDHKTIN